MLFLISSPSLCYLLPNHYGQVFCLCWIFCVEKVDVRVTLNCCLFLIITEVKLKLFLRFQVASSGAHKTCKKDMKWMNEWMNGAVDFNLYSLYNTTYITLHWYFGTASPLSSLLFLSSLFITNVVNTVGLRKVSWIIQEYKSHDVMWWLYSSPCVKRYSSLFSWP